MIDAHVDRDSPRAVERIMKSKRNDEINPCMMTAGTEEFVYYKNSKQNETKWMGGNNHLEHYWEYYHMQSKGKITAHNSQTRRYQTDTKWRKWRPEDGTDENWTRRWNQLGAND